MKRIDAIRNIMNSITNEAVISSCGRISREVYYVKDRPRNFYVMGSMGATLGIGIGVAISKPDIKVVVIAGDGDILMNLDTLILLNKLQDIYSGQALEKARKFVKNGDLHKINKIIVENKFNLELYILDNRQYQSTGGQNTISGAVEFRNLCDCKVIFCGGNEEDVPRIDIPHEKIKERFQNAIK